MKNSDYQAAIQKLLSVDYDVSKCLDRFNKVNQIQETTLEYLFSLPENKEVIFARVVVLNQTYSTGLSSNILSKAKYDNSERKYAIDVQHLAHHIYEKRETLNKYLENDSLVDAVLLIMQATADYDKFYNVYSFATKYCSWKYQRNEIAPIYDSYLHGMIAAYYKYRKLGELPNIKIENSNDGTGYVNYINCIKRIMKEKCFCNMSAKKVDSVLWQIAKEEDSGSSSPWELVDWEDIDESNC